MHIDLAVVWAAIIGLGVFIYVALDGFDLGIGLLFPFVESKAERQTMTHLLIHNDVNVRKNLAPVARQLLRVAVRHFP